MLTLHGIKMQNVWPPVARLKIKPRMTHNDETPVQGIMDWDQKEVLAEDIYSLHINAKSKHVMIMTLRSLVHWLSSIISTTVSVQNGMAINTQKETNRAKEAYFGPSLDSQVVPLSRCQSFDSITVWRAFTPCTYKTSACWFSVSSFAVGNRHLLLMVVTIKQVSQPGNQQGESTD